VAARVAALAGLASDDEATVVVVRGGGEHGITGFHNTVVATLNGGRVGVGDQVAAAASLCCLRLTLRTRLNAVPSAYGVV
jgi:hypothetical protein